MSSMPDIHRAIRSLRIVLVLSLIGSGWMCLSSLSMALMLPAMNQMVASQTVPIPDELQVAFEIVLQTPRSYYALLALLYAVSLVGIVMMWRLRRNGLHFYALSQLLILCVPVIFMGREFLSLGDIMMTPLFIGFYYLSLRGISQLQELESQAGEAVPSEPEAVSDDDNDTGEPSTDNR